MLKKCLAICHEYVDCFTTMAPEPLVETLQPGLFANRFPGEGHALWMLCNVAHVSMDGAALAVHHLPGARYYELWNDGEMRPQIEGDTARLSLRVDPHDLGCVVQIRE